MKGDFLITKEFLKELSPCTDGYRWFCETYPDGGKYQEILDRLCELDRFYDACWLFDKVGATDDVLELTGIDDKAMNICFAGAVIVKESLVLKNIKAGGFIETGGSIEAGGFIKAGEYIKAGWSIEADGSIEAGSDYGVYAGLSVRISDMKESGYVKAQERPKNLMCGYWEGEGYEI